MKPIPALRAFLLTASLSVGCASLPPPLPVEEPSPAPENPAYRSLLPPTITEEIIEAENAIEEQIPAEDTPDPGNAASPARKPPKKRIHKIPVEINETVEAWLLFFRTRGKERFERFLDRGERYEALVTRILKEKGIPTELYYLAMIESGFVVHARSRQRAVGIWQFIKPTARRYGLRVDRTVDERKDPIRATHAAASYLRDLYKLFGSWHLAMAAYNAGEGRIGRIVRKAGTRDFWELAERKLLPEETMHYVPKFIAASLIGHNPEKYGFRAVKDGKNHPNATKLRVRRRFDLGTFARRSGIPLRQLKELNPHLIRGQVPLRYAIWVPEGFDRSALLRSPASATHRVSQGESLHRIARRYGTTVSDLMKKNRLKHSRIRPGQMLRVR